MTTLAIVANHEKKRLSLTGTVAAGEHVAVTLEDGWAWANAAGAALRLRVVFAGKLIAEFPRRDADPADTWSASGDDATCELNINSIPAAKYLRCGGDCIWVLDDPQLNTLYGVGELEVLPWRREPGGDVPYNLDGYPDLLDEFEEVKDAVSEFDTKKINKSAFISLLGKTLPETATQKEVREMVHDILELLKNAAVCAALAFALPAFAIGTDTAWEDVPPQSKVRDIVEQFSPPADFSTNNTELVETIETTETDPTVPAWAKSPNPPTSGVDVPTAINIAEAAAASATNALSGSLSSAVSAASTASTNYTDSATAAKASTNDVQLTPVYSQTPTFSDWVIKRDGVDVTSHVAGQPVYEDHNGAMDWNVERCFYGDDTGYSEDDVFIPGETAAETLLSWRGVFPPDYDTAVYYTATRIRTDVIGYTLGAQTDKVLASTNLESGVSAAVVTNIVHDLSLGGIWDSALEVWWTPRMVNGSLTYHATTNVNLNAGN